jgi:hypothetical protein
MFIAKKHLDLANEILRFAQDDNKGSQVYKLMALGMAQIHI